MKKQAIGILLCTVLISAVVTAGFAVSPEQAEAATKKKTVTPARVVVSSVKSSDYNAITIKWKSAKHAKKYEVYRATSAKGKYKKIKTTTARSYTNTKLTTGKKYYYKVRAVRGKKKGKFSKAKAGTPKLKSVKISNVRCTDFTTIDLQWNRVAGASGYKVYRSDSQNGKYTLIATNKAGYRSYYADMKVKRDHTYYYKVRAYRTVKGKNYYSAYSAVKSGKAYIRDAETTKHLSMSGTRLPNGDVLVKVDNASDADDAMIRATIKVSYKDASGKEVGSTVNYLQYIHDLGTSYIRMRGPEDKNFNPVGYASYVIEYDGTLDFGIENNLRHITCTDEAVQTKNLIDGVKLTITNNASVQQDYVKYGIMFYKDGKLVDYNDGQISNLAAGATGEMTIIPQNLQKFDGYEVVPIHAVRWVQWG